MNQVNLIGRTTKEIEVRYSQGKDSKAIANVTLAVENPFSKDDEADFIRLVAFSGTAEFLEKYVEKGTRIGVTGRIKTGSYVHEDGHTVYTTEVVVSNVYFADSKKENSNTNAKTSNNSKGGYKSKSKK